MKNSFVISLVLMLLSACSVSRRVDRSFAKLKMSAPANFKGYRFVCDSLGKIEDLRQVCIENGFDLNNVSTVTPQIDKFRTHGKIYLANMSFAAFEEIPIWDSTISYTESEVNAFRRYVEVQNTHFEDTSNQVLHKKTIDSILKTADFKSYENKRFQSTKYLVILYPALIEKGRILVACRFYNTRRTSDDGYYFYKVY